MKAQAREIVIGGPAPFGTLLKEHFFARFEKSHNARSSSKGAVSLTHLEKMRANKARPTYSIVMMDDPVMVVADNEGLLGKITPENVANRAKIDPTAIHRGGSWVNYQAAAGTVVYNTKLLPDGIGSWAEAWEPKYKGRVVVPALRNTEGVLTLIMAAHLETGLPFDKALLNIDAGFRASPSSSPTCSPCTRPPPRASSCWSRARRRSFCPHPRSRSRRARRRACQSTSRTRRKAPSRCRTALRW